MILIAIYLAGCYLYATYAVIDTLVNHTMEDIP